jgi:hypothetical protein
MNTVLQSYGRWGKHNLREIKRDKSKLIWQLYINQTVKYLYETDFCSVETVKGSWHDINRKVVFIGRVEACGQTRGCGHYKVSQVCLTPHHATRATLVVPIRHAVPLRALHVSGSLVITQRDGWDETAEEWPEQKTPEEWIMCYEKKK